MKIPKPIENLINSFERLPGIGPKTAQRLTFYLLHFPQDDLEKFGEHLKELKVGTKLCSTCKNVSDGEICAICNDPGRDKNIIVVTSSPLDVFALEKAGHKGVYHVLHGVINPLDNIGPEELYIQDLIDRLHSQKSGQKSAADEIYSDEMMGNSQEPFELELILATNTSMEGESTAMYISKLVRDAGFDEHEVKITRIARGLPVGGDIEYADDITLSRALDGRIAF